MPHYASQILEDLSSGTSRLMKKTFEDLLFSIYKASREDDDGEGDIEDYDVYDEDDDSFGASKFTQPTLRTKKLQ